MTTIEQYKAEMKRIREELKNGIAEQKEICDMALKIAFVRADGRELYANLKSFVASECDGKSESELLNLCDLFYLAIPSVRKQDEFRAVLLQSCYCDVIYKYAITHRMNADRIWQYIND